MGRQPPVRVVVREKRAWTDETDAWKQDRAIRKGYRIRWGYVAIAYLVEALVICTSLAGAWFFAETYANRDDQSFWFMLLAPIVYAAIELCRVPLGILIRVQRTAGKAHLHAARSVGAAVVSVEDAVAIAVDRAAVTADPAVRCAGRAHVGVVRHAVAVGITEAAAAGFGWPKRKRSPSRAVQ